MRLDPAFPLVSSILPEELDRFRSSIDPTWISDALTLTDTATVRKRRLPSDQVFWLVVGMALMRNESIERVCTLLDLALPARGGESVAKSAIIQARHKLGAEPLEYVFTVSAEEWTLAAANERCWRGLRLFGFDGSTMRVPDSPENWDAFGGPKSNGVRSGTGYPMVRVVALMALRARLLLAFRMGPYSTGEVSLARELWASVPEDSLVLGDRNFSASKDLCGLAELGGNRHWLVRLKKTLHTQTLESFSRTDRLVEVTLSAQARRAAGNVPERWIARAIKYQRKGFPPGELLTSLLDPKAYPASEVVALYHERWELELGFDEVKTHMLQREEAIRSRKPDGVRQELWSIALAYNLVRWQMGAVARVAKLEPNRISFVNALSLIRASWLSWSTPPLAPGRIPEALARLLASLRLLVLPERRPERSFPREVKLKMSNYNRKEPAYRGDVK